MQEPGGLERLPRGRLSFAHPGSDTEPGAPGCVIARLFSYELSGLSPQHVDHNAHRVGQLVHLVSRHLFESDGEA